MFTGILHYSLNAASSSANSTKQRPPPIL